MPYYPSVLPYGSVYDSYCQLRNQKTSVFRGAEPSSVALAYVATLIALGVLFGVKSGPVTARTWNMR